VFEVKAWATAVFLSSRHCTQLAWPIGAAGHSKIR
jgi:hypothetical protein